MVTEENDDEKRSGVEKGVSDHPLAEDYAEQGSSTASASSSYTAELVQSAARSLLDTSATLLADDDSTKGEEPSPSSSAALASLQTEKMPALPDEQDRKRFIVR